MGVAIQFCGQHSAAPKEGNDGYLHTHYGQGVREPSKLLVEIGVGRAVGARWGDMLDQARSAQRHKYIVSRTAMPAKNSAARFLVRDQGVGRALDMEEAGRSRQNRMVGRINREQFMHCSDGWILYEDDVSNHKLSGLCI
jgi:hypothetical protein